MDNQTFAMLAVGGNVIFCIIGMMMCAAFIIGCFYNQENKIFKTLAFFCLLISVNAFISGIPNLINTSQENSVTESIWRYLLSNVVEICIIGYLFIFQIKYSNTGKRIVAFLVISDIIFQIFDTFTYRIHGLNQIMPYAPIYHSFIICLICTLYLIETLKNNTALSSSVTLFSLTFLFFYAINIIYDLSINLIINKALEIDAIAYFFMSRILFQFAFAVIIFLLMYQYVIKKSQRLEIDNHTLY